MGIIFNDKNNQQTEMLPYKRGPNAAYMAHVNQLGNRKMLEEVWDFISLDDFDLDFRF